MFHVHGLEDNTMKIIMNHRQYNSNQNSTRIFCLYGQADANIFMEIQRTQNWQFQRSTNEVGQLTLSDLKIYYNVTVINVVWYKNRYRDQ